jgi:hypothetical protein
MKMLDRGYARFDHLEGRIEGVEMRVDLAEPDLGGKPEFERQIGRAKLERRQSDMVMAVDEAGEHHIAERPDHRPVGIRYAQRIEWADRRNDAVTDRDRSIIDDPRPPVIADPSDDRSPPDQELLDWKAQ